MKQPIMLGTSLQDFHWDDLANLHFDLQYLRDRFIHAVNKKVAANSLPLIEELDQLAKVDDLLQAAADRMEAAKSALFNLCYDGRSPAGPEDE